MKAAEADAKPRQSMRLPVRANQYRETLASWAGRAPSVAVFSY